MVETKDVNKEIEELEKKLMDLKATIKKEPEVKERLTFEVIRILKTNYNWKFVAGAIFAWFILWIFNH